MVWQRRLPCWQWVLLWRTVATDRGMAWVAALAMGREARRGVQREPARPAADRAAVPAMGREDAVQAPDQGCVKAWGRGMGRGMGREWVVVHRC